jgi:YHS domain-containing protein
MKRISIFLMFITTTMATAQVDPINKDGVAIGGYDVVAYFKNGKAVKGDPDVHVEFNGANYYFSSEENERQFRSNPGLYVPQYDGYCALAVGTTGKKISIDPKTFKITNGKLYLFFNGKSFSGTMFNSLEPWIKDEPNLLKKADDMWPAVKQRKYKR